MQLIDGAGKVPMKWSYTHTSCTSCHNICCTACVLSSIYAASVHAGVSVMHSSVIHEASFSDLASRTHLVQRNAMFVPHHTSCTVSAHGRLGRIQVSCLVFVLTCSNTRSRVWTVQNTLLTAPVFQLNDRYLRCSS